MMEHVKKNGHAGFRIYPHTIVYRVIPVVVLNNKTSLEYFIQITIPLNKPPQALILIPIDSADMNLYLGRYI